jgi:hypothetical protein
MWTALAKRLLAVINRTVSVTVKVVKLGRFVRRLCAEALGWTYRTAETGRGRGFEAGPPLLKHEPCAQQEVASSCDRQFCSAPSQEAKCTPHRASAMVVATTKPVIASATNARLAITQLAWCASKILRSPEPACVMTANAATQ